MPEADGKVVDAKGDARLRAAVEENADAPFAAVAVFGRDAFLGQSAMLDQASVTILNEFGNAAILLLRPPQVLPLLRDPSVRRIAWFGPQDRLARLHPSLELELLSRYGRGAEDREMQILARYRYVPGDRETKLAADAGFRTVSGGGPDRVLAGPASGVPRLLSDDTVIYLEKTDRASVPGAKVTTEVPHAQDTLPGIRERERTHPLPPQEGGAIPFRTYPRNDNGADAPSGDPGTGNPR